MRSALNLLAPTILLLVAAQAQAQSGGISSPKTLPDGMIVASPIWIAAEMLQDPASANRKYADKAIELAGPLSNKTVAGKLGLAQIVITLPGRGYWRFSCATYEPASIDAIGRASKGEPITMAGIYDTDPYRGISRSAADAMEDTAHIGALDTQNTMHLRDCVVLSGRADAEEVRALVAAGARRPQ
ncbi:MAG: hypothetical protein JSR91_10870 [Proteobacteria bacterium]|nr:hypothetical protein [Pseudomonadota bacterium]